MSMSTSSDLQERSAARHLLPLVAIVFSGFLSIGIPLPALPLHVNGTLGYSAAVVGWIIGIQSFATIFTRKFAGSWCDRHGPKQSVSLGLPLASCAGVLYLVSTWIADPLASIAVLTLGRLLMGPAESLFLTGTMTWGIGRVGIAKTGKVMAWQGIAMFAALGLGGPLGVAIQQQFGFAGIAWTTIVLPLIGFAVARMLSALAVTRGNVQCLSFMGALALIWRFGLALALAAMPFAILTSFLVLLYGSYGWQGAGYAILGFSLGYIGVRLFFAHLPDRIGGARVGAVSVAIELAGQLMLWLAHDPMIALAGSVLTGIGFSLVFPSMGVQAMARVPAHSRGMAVACFMAFIDVASGLTGPIVGIVIGWYGYPAAFLAGALACVASLAVMWSSSFRRGKAVAQG
ncbi:MAG: putative MFS-type transporter YfcJ [Herbaspirillum frisingense]|uniref:Putative MFS-type transporter YfcJ n=1 Tax=Herbaspirillum frisingense TaxID=92645 RepID=A0A7V8FVB6_9BURK|nr:MAG: putative MFS-type transporter YfcJ [Herbaspirillum frisingense]